MSNENPIDVLTSIPQTSDKPKILDRPKLIIGEGKDDLLFLTSLLRHLKITDILVEEYEGKDNLPSYLDTLLKRPGFHDLISIGITRDADRDAGGAFTSIRNHLVRRGLVAPDQPQTMRQGNPSVGILLFPAGLQQGMLEDLLLSAISADPVLNCIDDYFDCVSATTQHLPRQISKAKVHAWLATKHPPDLELGRAAQKGLIDWDSPAFQQLKDFLVNL